MPRKKPLPPRSAKSKRYQDSAQAITLANLEEPRQELTEALPESPIILSPIHVWQLGYEQRRRKRELEKNLHKTEVVLDPEKDPRWKKRGEG